MCSDDDDISIRLLAICYHSEKNCKVNEYQVKDNKELESQMETQAEERAIKVV